MVHVICENIFKKLVVVLVSCCVHYHCNLTSAQPAEYFVHLSSILFLSVVLTSKEALQVVCGGGVNFFRGGLLKMTVGVQPNHTIVCACMPYNSNRNTGENIIVAPFALHGMLPDSV